MNHIRNIENLRSIQDAFNRISSAVGNKKQEVIRDVCNKDFYVKVMLKIYLDPLVVFGIGKLSLRKNVDVMFNKEYEDFCELLIDLAEPHGASNQIIANIQHYLSGIVDAGLREFAEGYITRSITLGATGKTLNKALGERAVFEPECMLANKYFDHADYVKGKVFVITEKLDGIRCIAVLRKDEKPVFFTRQGQAIEGLAEIEAALSEINANVMLDGELIISDRERYESKEQYKQTTKIVRKDGEKHGVTYHVFDMVLNGGYNIPYLLRRESLDALVRGMCPFVEPVPVLYQGSDTDVIPLLLDQQRKLGCEGIMINIADAPYQTKRTKDLLKCKAMQDCDLKIIGFMEGGGKFAGTLGSIIVDYKGNPLGVGSGFTDQMRHEIWQNQAKYLGRVATIQYFEETNDADGKLSLRFSVFKEIRELGKEISYH